MAQRNKSRNNQEQSVGNQRGNQGEDQRAADQMIQGNKGKQQQGNYGSRQGEGGNRGKRGNRGLG